MKLKIVTGIMLTLLMLSMVMALMGKASLPSVIAQASSTTMVYLDQPTINGTVTGEDFTVNIMIRDAQNIYCWQAGLTFNPHLLNCTGLSEGRFLSDVEGPAGTYFIRGIINNTAGTVWPPSSCTLLGKVPGASGNGILSNATFKVKAPGVSDIHLSDVKMVDSNLNLVPVNIIDVYTAVVGTIPHKVVTVSNLTGSAAKAYGCCFYDYAFNSTLKEISFKVAGPYSSFSNVTIPKALLPPPVPSRAWAVIINGTPVSMEKIIVTENATHTYLYFTYPAGLNDVQITTRFMPSVISITLSSASITLGSSVTISGFIDPLRPHVNVTILYRSIGGVEWAVLANVTTNDNGTYSCTWKPLEAGTYEFKAYWGGDEITLGDESDIKTVLVMPVYRDLAVSLDAPEFVLFGSSARLNATVHNLGLSNETNVELWLFINKTIAVHEIIPALASDASYTLTYMWNPTTQGTYNITAYVPKVPEETYTYPDNNIAIKFATVSITAPKPLIHPSEGQWAKYTMTAPEPYGENTTMTISFNYSRYITPYLINTTFTVQAPEAGQYMVGWTTIDILHRWVESGIWANTWYLGWIETNITLGSTVNLLGGTATVVDSRIIKVGGYLINCWELLLEDNYGINYTLWYDKTSGLWIGMEYTYDSYSFELKLVTTNIPLVGVPEVPPLVALDVDVDVGSIHFRGEVAEFYVLVSLLGDPIDAGISATLYFNGTSYADLSASVEHVATGLYRIAYTIPTEAPTGTYALVVNASYLTIKGTSLKTFLLSPTLTGWNAWLVGIQGNIATIKADVATIKASLEAINAKLVSIEGRIATINSTIGLIQADVADIKLNVTVINGNIATIQTTLGTIEGRITSIEGCIATIETDVGTIKTALEGWTGGTTSSVTTPQGTFQILVLTTSTLEDPITFSDNVLVLSLTGPSGTTGTTNVVIPKQFLVGIESSIDKVVVTIDDEKVIFTYTENPEAYVLHITYTHSTHLIKIYLAGLPPTPFPAWVVVVIVLIVATATGIAFYRLKIRKHEPLQIPKAPQT
jgi:hypothetical protein